MDRLGGVRIIEIKTQTGNGLQSEALDHHRPFDHYLGICTALDIALCSIANVPPPLKK